VAIASRATGKRIETWLSPLLARELKKLADRDRRSMSAVIRNAVEDKLRDEERGPLHRVPVTRHSALPIGRVGNPEGCLNSRRVGLYKENSPQKKRRNMADENKTGRMTDDENDRDPRGDRSRSKVLSELPNNGDPNAEEFWPEEPRSTDDMADLDRYRPRRKVRAKGDGPRTLTA
jgi:hypothetical protein